MDDKELIKKVKNSFKAKKTRAEIMTGFQKKGYKLEYADAIMKKAMPHGTWFYISMAIILILIILIVLAAYLLFFQTGEKQDLQNPLGGLNIIFKGQSLVSNTSESINIEDIIITPEFLSYLLNEIGAWQLHSNPTTFEKPIINFKVGEDYFNSLIDDGIETLAGVSENADIQFNTNKEDLVKAILSDIPSEVFKESVTEGRTEIQTIASEPELFTKGYLKLYNSLK